MGLKTLAAVSAAVLSLSCAGSVLAQTYAFSFTGPGVSGSGKIFTADANSSSQVIDITGTVYDSLVGTGPFSITGLSNYAGADNILSTTSPFADFGGISFTTNTGGDFNIGGGGGAPQGLLFNSSVADPGGEGNGSPTISLNVSAVSAAPEPSAWALLMLGVGGIGLMMSRSKKAIGLRNQDAAAA